MKTLLLMLLVSLSLSLNAAAQQWQGVRPSSTGITLKIYRDTTDTERDFNINSFEKDRVKIKGQKYFNNHIYLQIWGHSVYSLNYFRFLQSPNVVVGGGVGVSFHVRNPPFTSTEGPIVIFFGDKQFLIAKKFHFSMGVGGTYDFQGAFESFSDPFYWKAAINRYSVSSADDRLYYGLDLYYIKWQNWAIRPSVKLGISF